MTNAEAIETLRANYPDACYEQLREAVDVAIEALKARDAGGERLVRCKDCKYKHGSACEYSAVWVRPNGFCHWGERREDEHTD